ncbi:MAG: hypothetical protein KH354_00655 [Clostridiales bacterium]|nr:hypothetical protein [Clostridiales bacterium]
MKKWFTVLLLMVFGCMCSACGMRITFDAQSSQPSGSETVEADAYNRLKDWIFAKGTTKGNEVRFYESYYGRKTRFSLVWYEDRKEISLVDYYYGHEGTDMVCWLFMGDIMSDNCEWKYSAGGDDIEINMRGEIQPSRFSSKTPITYNMHIGNKSDCDGLLEMARVMLNDSIEWLSWILDRYDIGLTLKDFGFLAW